MARVIFTNLTDEQASELASWYSNQGEQDADVWFDIANVETPITDTITKDGDDVIVACK
jgi:hypothetical protein